jgi:hypothetical protein
MRNTVSIEAIQFSNLPYKREYKWDEPSELLDPFGREDFEDKNCRLFGIFSGTGFHILAEKGCMPTGRQCIRR